MFAADLAVLRHPDYLATDGMDAPTADPTPEPDPSVSQWTRPDSITILPETKHTSLDEGLFQQVKDLHAQVENHLKTLPVNEELVSETVDALVGLDCPLPAKFSMVNVADLIKKNKNVKGSESLSTLVSALGLLEKYGRNLLKPERPKLWKHISFANSVFRTRVDIIKGAREVLQLMGYSEVVEDGLHFPLDVDSPYFDTVAVVTADLAIAKREIELYDLGEHPHAYRIKDCLDGKMAMIQVPGDSPTGRPKNIFMRRSGSSSRTVYENFNISQPPSLDFPILFQQLNLGTDKNKSQMSSVAEDEPTKKQGSANVAPEMAPNEPNPYTSTPNPKSQIEGIVRKIGEPTPSPRHLPADVGLAYFANNSKSAAQEKNTTPSADQQSSQMASQKESQLPSSTQQPGQMNVVEQGNDCVMCGKAKATVQCNVCSGLRCDSCDNQWHHHPHRRGHERKVIETAPVIKTATPQPQSLPCFVCGIQPACLFCVDCSSSSCTGKYCSDCDMVYHGHPHRKNHTRKPLELSGVGPTTQPPPKTIVLSPVTTTTTTTTQESPKTTDSSSSSMKKRPVPAPRRTKSFTPKEPAQSQQSEGEAVSDDVFTTEKTKEVHSDVKGPSRWTTTRTKSDSSATKDTPVDFIPPKLHYSMPSTKNDILSEIEVLVEKDIQILQKIQAGREVMSAYIKSSSEYSELEKEQSSLMSEHLRLLARQKELEEFMKKSSSSAETGVEVGVRGQVMLKYPPTKDNQESPPEQAETPVASWIKYPPSDSTRVFPATVSATMTPTPSQQNVQRAPTGAPLSYQGPTLGATVTKPVISTKPTRIGILSAIPQMTAGVLPPISEAHDRPKVLSPKPGNGTIASQSGKVQEMMNRINSVTTASSVGTTTGGTQAAPGAWLCLHCGDHNTASLSSYVCKTCGSPMPEASQKPSVAALGQQLGPAIALSVPGHQLQAHLKPTLTAQSKPEVPQSQVEAAASGGTRLPAKTPLKQPETMSVFTYLQMEEEAMLKEKQKAKEEYEARMAAERGASEELPSPPPRVKREAKKAEAPPQPFITSLPGAKQQAFSKGNDVWQPQPAGVPTPLQPVTHSLQHVMWTEERRRLDEQRAQSLDFIKILREAEKVGYFPEEVFVASENIREMKEEALDELQWLQDNWEEKYVATVTAMATNHLKEEVGKSVGMVRKEESRKALRKHYGNVQRAVEECVSEMQKRILALVEMGFSHKRVCELLTTRDGEMDDVLAKLQREQVRPLADYIWVPEDNKKEEKMITDMGVDRHPDTVERRLRILLAEYELPSWGRAVTATRLIDTGKYETSDAIIAAKECGDFERAKQYLEKECKVCYTEFPMNKLSTLISCQCTICEECLHDHFSIVVNSRHILNANCPVCDTPDLRGSDQVATDYFGFLDLLLKGLLEAESYQLFQNKMRDWNLMKENNFRWCAHCGNGFINEAPDRRKMRCPECNELTCFLCKKPWMDQHENISCAEFQAWKEANDPNRQQEGLAIHLKENGIDCPHCKMRYELAKGGCMHFKCGQCMHEFCCGCSSPFTKGADCGRFASCAGRGLHAHHPRDCLFYLRDLDIKVLQKQLKKHNVNYKKDNPANRQPVCTVMEQKELPNGLEDAHCGREVHQAGLCEIHYKEYLVSMINQNHIDPADMYSVEALRIILDRNEIPVPARQDREAEDAYGARLLQEVKQKLPLDQQNPRDRSQSVPGLLQ